MRVPRPSNVIPAVPWLTLLIGLGALAIYGSTEMTKLLVFDRPAILRGQAWRLLTGHLVHFSGQHLAANLVIFAVAGAASELSGRGQYLKLCMASSLLTGASLFIFEPRLLVYGGLSGIATACAAALCLSQAAKRPTHRGLWYGILGLIAAKVVFETLSRRPLFVSSSTVAFEVMPLAHCTGMLSAAILHMRPVSPNTKRPVAIAGS